MTEKKRSQWDAGRFFQTLAYFDIIPGLAWLRQLLQSGTKDNENKFIGKKMGVVLVAGATGGVGKRVVQRLIDKGYQVRSLVRDIDKAKANLDKNTEICIGDITKPETLTDEIMAVQAVVCCTAVRVQPVEGDTPDRAKYNQGIKFYQPEIVGDTPERVEYQGVKNLVDAAARHLRKAPATKKVIFDFTNPSADLKQIWGAVDDVVMGGVSESNIQLVEGTALFAGNVSTANSGGFASIRTKNFDSPLNLSGYEGVELRVRGDGKRYKFFLRTDTKWDGIGYSYSFDTVANEWITVQIPFDKLIPVFRAKTLQDCPAIDKSKIYSFQLMLSKFEYNGELNPQFSPGGFALQVESIAAYGGAALPQFILVSSA
ncbi:MAG TPA: NADH:ubiquinone oxidoreductase, partial [Cyanobacteria bacterium UBA11049]|nr:NADH:ubiquinone oxidoreductase [Cyanobacteria bacterium UBA11049]